MMASSEKVKVRFAPSPTGRFHIGSARTALFNWIFAKSKKGEFVLRIEDTDMERSSSEFEEDIKNGLGWFGIEWDEFYKQSERISVYKEYIEKLFADGWAYYCFCTKEELESDRQAMLSQGLAPKYSGRCRGLDEKEAKKRVENGEDHVIRFKVKEAKISFRDLIRGNISFDSTLMGDIVIAKDTDRPLYNFAVVVDDALIGITHVIRGEDHISNTPRQILIMNALGFDVPKFAHLPMILNPDKSKMSKRFSDTAIGDYIDAGYPRDAIVNFLAFLGWHPKDDKDIMSIDEIIGEFSISRVQKGGAIFSEEKLDWYGGQYINAMDTKSFIKEAKNFLPKNWMLTEPIIKSVKSRVKKFSELKELVDFYFELPDYNPEILRWKNVSLKDTAGNLERGLSIIDGIPGGKFEQKNLENMILEEVPKENRGDILWPMRVALSGKKESPSPFEIMEALGKEESEKRIKSAIDKTGSLRI